MKSMLKKVLALSMVVTMLFGTMTMSSFAASKVALVVEGKTIAVSASEGTTFIDANNRTQVPVRALAESLGQSVAWSSSTQTATIGGTIIIKIGSSELKTANGSIKMDTAAIVKDGRTYVPVRYIAEALGLGVTASTNTSGMMTVKLAKLTGKIVIAGSTSSQTLSDELAAAFKKQYPGVTLEVQGGGSGVGIAAAKSGTCDIGSASRELSASETGYQEYIFAKDGVAMIANNSVSVSGLSMDQIRKIFIGEITNWKEVGGADKAIVVVSREAGSGTRGAFVELTKVQDSAKVDQTTVNAIVQPSTGAVLQTVKTTPDSIGYVSLGSLDSSVKSLTVDGVYCNELNVINKTYKISRPFIYVTYGTESAVTKTYLDWVMRSEAQKIVSADFISVSK